MQKAVQSASHSPAEAVGVCLGAGVAGGPGIRAWFEVCQPVAWHAGPTCRRVAANCTVGDCAWHAAVAVFMQAKAICTKVTLVERIRTASRGLALGQQAVE